MSYEVLVDDVRYVPAPDSSQWDETYPAKPPQEKVYLSPHFRESEFACNHCGAIGSNGIDQELLVVLERLRSDLGNNPVTITSGYRCKTHNDNVGSNDSSQHRKGTAADIQVKNVTPNNVHAYLSGKYPTKYGLGRYDSFTHIDVREDGPARW